MTWCAPSFDKPYHCQLGMNFSHFSSPRSYSIRLSFLLGRSKGRSLRCQACSECTVSFTATQQFEQICGLAPEDFVHHWWQQCGPQPYCMTAWWRKIKAAIGSAYSTESLANEARSLSIHLKPPTWLQDGGQIRESLGLHIVSKPGCNTAQELRKSSGRQ